jgi:hypothetical protein
MTDSKFDSDAWKAQKGAKITENRRAALVPALEREMRVGMTRNEVRELLGEPDSTTDRSDTYRLGVAPFGIDPEFYRITYDAQGRVTTFRLIRG